MQSTKTVLDIGTRLTAILGLGTGEAEAADRTVAMQTIEGTEVRETEHTMHKTDRQARANEANNPQNENGENAPVENNNYVPENAQQM